ncbi:hypothetical protein [Candidatus Lokiarchaeum ossiferum]|uniref:hypothetical protein n=1 Tax=Candidatus Lokiarchaeum ossiferum TaxID=2951803 RepID=UPI00352C1BE6
MIDIVPLTIHPRPNPGEKMSIWLSRIAEQNLIEFVFFIKIIGVIAQLHGLETTVKKLTTISSAEYNDLEFDLRDQFWNDQYSCPIKDCQFKKANQNSNVTLRKHLQSIHNIGVKWYYCILCGHKAKQTENISHHLKKVHHVKLSIRYADFKSRQLKRVDYLDCLTTIEKKDQISQYNCKFCDYSQPFLLKMRVHLAYIHGVEDKGLYCDLCNYRTNLPYMLTKHKILRHNIKKSKANKTPPTTLELWL